MRKLLLLPLLWLALCGAITRDFDGVDDSIASAYTTAYPSTYSISVWINPDTLGETAGRITTRLDLDMFFIANDTGSTTIEFLRFNHEFTGTDGQWSTNTLTGAPLDAWSHWVVTFDSSSASNNPVWWKNGASFTTFTETSTPTLADADNTSEIFIGNNDAADRSWDGSIYFLSVYDHILTAAEVSIVYYQPEFAVGLLYQVPVWESSGNEKDLAGGLAGTVTGLTSRTDSPPVMIGVHMV